MMRFHERGIPKSPFQEALDEVALGDFHRIHSLYLDPRNEYGFRIVIRTKCEGDDEGFHHFAIWDHKDNIMVAAIPDPGGDFAEMQLIARSDSYWHEKNRARVRGLRNTDSSPTDINTLYEELESRILDLEGVSKTLKRKDGTKAFKSDSGKAQFIADFRLCTRKGGYVSVRLRMPFDQIDDPYTMCEKSAESGITRFKLNAADDLDYAMQLIQQAYNHNLVE